jgi:hypothetical protein
VQSFYVALAMLLAAPSLAHIDRTMRLEPPWPGHYRVRSLSSAVRGFVFKHMEAAAGGDAIEGADHSCEDTN